MAWQSSLNKKGKSTVNLKVLTGLSNIVLLCLYRAMWREIGKTEVIMDNLAPAWVKSFEVPYHFERRERYRVVVYDIDDFNNLNNYDGHDLVGQLEFVIHEVVSTANQSLERHLECD